MPASGAMLARPLESSARCSSRGSPIGEPTASPSVAVPGASGDRSRTRLLARFRVERLTANSRPVMSLSSSAPRSRLRRLAMRLAVIGSRASSVKSNLVVTGSPRARATATLSFSSSNCTCGSSGSRSPWLAWIFSASAGAPTHSPASRSRTSTVSARKASSPRSPNRKSMWLLPMTMSLPSPARMTSRSL